MSRSSKRAINLTAEKQALLEALLREEGVESPTPQRIQRRKNLGPVPLSFAQQRLWFLDQLAPGNAAYNIPEAIRMSGRLDIKRLEESLSEIVRRHEVLRTSFPTVEGMPVQVIAPPQPMRLPVIDLSVLPEAEREAKAQSLAAEEAERPFDLHHGPLLRASLLRLGEESHIVLFTMHHIISDAWSMEVLVREVAALYEAFSQGKPSPLADFPIQYADFAIWQRESLQAELLDEQLSYWRRQLEGAARVLELPTDRSRPAIQSYRGANQLIELGDGLSGRLSQLARREEMTLFMVMLAAFKVLLYRLSGQQDISVGTPVAGRTRAEIEGLIGFFVNTLVMRSEIKGGESFKEVMRREREVVLEAFAHQDVPFERVVEELQPERSLSHTPLFQVAFNFLNEASQSEIRLPELSLNSVGGEVETSKYDLVLVITEDEGRLFVDLRYSTDLFDESTIKRMLVHFQNLIEAAVADPLRPVSALPMLTQAEVRQLLVERNDTSSPYPRHNCAHHLFEHQASHTPDADALVCEAEQLSYGELNRRANQIANYLRGLGVGPETLVGVCMNGSMDLVVATLGILKAGGAFVPLDPDYPKRRLAQIMEESMMPVLLTREDMEERLPAHWGQIVFLDSDWEMIAAHSQENPAADVDPENLAYVIYTSGSTGKPKGVQITHGALLNLVYWHRRNFAVTPADRATQVAGVAFDASVWEVWPYLTAGASIHFPNDEIRTSPLQLLDWLVSKKITISFLPTPLAESLLSVDWPDGAALRALLTGGDKLHHHPAKPLPFDLVNNYGPSESTVVATSGPVLIRPHEEAAPTIGRPIDNTQVYLLDFNLQLVPDGAPGELYIGGSSLARGYLLQPEMTAEKFLPDPFGDQPGARMYRTGDLARYSADGSIEFLNRIDDQVKVRGFRIELGEIETALSRHAALQDAMVIAREDTPGEKRLVAYLVCKPDQAPNISELRAYLKERLPEYMIPQSFVTLDRLPLSPNGKVDRRALPAPNQSRPQLDRAFVAPRNELEHFLADKWREVLGIEEVGVHDDFFDMGGESLKAAILVNKIQQELGEMLQVVSIFDAPNIAAFADYLNKDCQMAVSRLLGNEPQHERVPAVIKKIDPDKVVELRRLITPLPPRAPRDSATTSKNPPAIFVLSSPRSGLTLLRVMLGGHPLLFAPPELELLSFNTLEERSRAFSGRDSFWLEGAIRAVMEIKGCDAEEAKKVIEECEARKLTTRQFYGLIEEWLGERMLVDKTPSYAMDLEVLNRAETDFSGALFIHLLRSPQGMIRSYEEAKLDQIFPRFKHPFSAREVAELVWVISHQNILHFLRRVPEERQHRIKFEEMVNEPEAVMRGVCHFLGIEFDLGMVRPYEEKEKKMTNGIHTVSRMLGDIKFHQHTDIDPEAAGSWRKYYPNDFLGEITLELAESLGYKEERNDSRSSGPNRKAITPIQPVAGDAETEQMLADLDRLSNEQVDALLVDMLAETQDNG